MSKTYHLPCQCGQTVVVSDQQAGEMIACSCGMELEIPSLRALTQLPPAKKDTTDQPVQQRTSQGSWSITAGILFSLGGFLLIIGGGKFIDLWVQTTQIKIEQPDDISQKIRQTIHTMELKLTFRYWDATQRGETPDALLIKSRSKTPEHVKKEESKQRLGKRMLTFAGLASLGLSLIIGAAMVSFFQKQSASQAAQ